MATFDAYADCVVPWEYNNASRSVGLADAAAGLLPMLVWGPLDPAGQQEG